MLYLKGKLRVISSDPLCKDANARLKTMPLKPLSDQVLIRYQFFVSLNLIDLRILCL